MKGKQMFYACIDPNNKICMSVYDTDENNDPNYIPIDTFDTSLIGKIYDEKTNTFTRKPVLPVEQVSMSYIQEKVNSNSSKNETNATGIDDLGSVVSDLSTALDDLASAFAELQEAKNG